MSLSTAGHTLYVYTTLKVHLKRSKCDQLGKGVDVFVGHTGKLMTYAQLLLFMHLWHIRVRQMAPSSFVELKWSTAN